jgi:aminoglycoside phosphotransferase (APT) family kinase protein
MPPAERSVTPGRAAALIDARFPELGPARAELVGEGWDNFAFRVNGGLMFRFPRRQIAVELIEKENRLLPAIAGRLPLPTPNPRWFAYDDEPEPWPFLGYEMLPGESACAAELDDAERAALAAPIGEFLAALHRLPVEGAPPDQLGRLEPARLARTRANLAALESAGLISGAKSFFAILDDCAPLEPRPPVLVHGDLYIRHLLLNRARQLCGVIDWGDLHQGDPAVDLSIAHSVLPPAAHGAFLSAYGPVDDDRWRWARLRALHHCTVIALSGHETGDRALLREALGGLARIQEN